MDRKGAIKIFYKFILPYLKEILIDRDKNTINCITSQLDLILPHGCTVRISVSTNSRILSLYSNNEIYFASYNATDIDTTLGIVLGTKFDDVHINLLIQSYTKKLKKILFNIHNI